ALQAGRALPVVRGPPAAGRQAAPIPARLGTEVAQRHTHADARRPFRRWRPPRPTRRRPQPPRTRHLPPSARCPRRQTARTAPRVALAACLSRVQRRVARTVLRGPRRSNAPGLPGDDDFGPAFIKVCTYCPWPIKVWVNGHEWAKRQAVRTWIGLTEQCNGLAATDDTAAL